MAYMDIVQMAGNQSLITRIGACAAQQGHDSPMQWAQQNVLTIVIPDDWISAWSTAEANKSVNVNPDTGARTDVITDEMILARVQTILKPDNGGGDNSTTGPVDPVDPAAPAEPTTPAAPTNTKQGEG